MIESGLRRSGGWHEIGCTLNSSPPHCSFNQTETIANDPKILTKLSGRLRVGSPEGRLMTEHQLKEQEFQIARYRRLEREVTDPLAACLLHSIIEELEAELRKDRPDWHGPRD
ncbi:hypothetical protein [Bradyrhizobium sp. Rc2d]|uniref:hypothetical protein n=2 Tax=Nitrobacteraceae TaxID=41294 RepID=UPI000A91DDA7|nr:hypothetical protein [Bradyrhizobium sp. Rc2d]